MSDETRIREQEVTEITEGEKLFSAYGFSHLKVQRAEEISILKVPIRSISHEAFTGFLKKHGAKATNETMIVKKDSREGRQHKLKRDALMEVRSRVGGDYQFESDEAETQFALDVVNSGTPDLKLRNKNGEEVKDRDGRIAILRQVGLSSDHFLQLFRDIRGLTSFAEEEEADFFDENSSGEGS